MNKYIVFAFAVFALIASGNCGSNYGSKIGYSNLASIPAPVYSAPYSHSSRVGPNYSVQPVYAKELFPGKQNYRTYNSAPVYSQVSLPVVPSVPVANVLLPAHSSSYGAPAFNYAPY